MKMRASLRIESLSQDGREEKLQLRGVCKANRLFGVSMQVTIENPDLMGTFKVGQAFFVEFHEADVESGKAGE